MRKNPNGYGTVYKLSGNRRRPYIARRTIGWEKDKNGKYRQKYQTIGYYATRKEGLKALNEFWAKGVVQAGDITLEQLYNEWAETHFDMISASTQRQYMFAYSKSQPLHHVKFTDLRTAHIQNLINDNAADLTRGSLEKIKLLFSVLYKYAIQNDISVKNYAQYVTLPKSVKKEKEIFTDVEIKKMWDHIDLPNVNIILGMIYTGMRVGEFLGLTVFQIDLKNMLIRGGSKTDAGKNRTIPIHPDIRGIMQNLVNNAKIGSGKIFTRNYDYFRRGYRSALDELGINYKSPHACRHTFITRMVKNGADAVALQKIVGHANYSTTAEIYTHLDSETLAKEIKKMQ